MRISSSDHLQPFKEVLINGIWSPYCECRVVPDDTIDPNTIKPSVAFPVKVLGIGVFKERINGVVQDGTSYVPETHIYWGLV